MVVGALCRWLWGRLVGDCGGVRSVVVGALGRWLWGL